MSEETVEIKNFIRDIIAKDLSEGKNSGKVITRFPPEPNGYLHIGHAKAICLNYGIAKDYNGTFHLRMDDTNPEKESMEYVESIKKDISWLGCEWGENFFFASDYYEKLYDQAMQLVKLGKAYVCDLSAEEVREYRGNLTTIGTNSPYRERSIDENIELFTKMRDGDFAEGSKTLRAKIDMSHANIHLRDPAIYRIRKVSHFRCEDKWCIYPMYDFAHCFEDSFEGITHSICTLEFEIHRPVYDWFLDALNSVCHPQQIEFARLNLTYTVMSKRKLLQLVNENCVSGWDDPRMPTISGMRRRGYTPASIHTFCDTIGVTKYNSLTDVALLEHCVRDDLNDCAPRAMTVLEPLKIVIENYPEDLVEDMVANNHPSDEEMGTRTVPFSREIYIDRDDFREVPPRKYRRMFPGNEVRLKYGYFVTCNEAIKDENGEVIELRCTYDPDSRGGKSPDGRKVRGTIHWVSAAHAKDIEIRNYDRLFKVENPDDCAEGETFLNNLNEDSLTISTAKAEPTLMDAKAGDIFQFERKGFYCVDPDSTSEKMVFNLTVAMRSSWAKIEQKQQQQSKKSN